MKILLRGAGLVLALWFLARKTALERARSQKTINEDLVYPGNGDELKVI